DGFWEKVDEAEMEIDYVKSRSAAEWTEYLERRITARLERDSDNYTLVAVSVLNGTLPLVPSGGSLDRSSVPESLAWIGTFVVAAAVLAGTVVFYKPLLIRLIKQAKPAVSSGCEAEYRRLVPERERPRTVDVYQAFNKTFGGRC